MIGPVTEKSINSETAMMVKYNTGSVTKNEQTVSGRARVTATTDSWSNMLLHSRLMDTLQIKLYSQAALEFTKCPFFKTRSLFSKIHKETLENGGDLKN